MTDTFGNWLPVLPDLPANPDGWPGFVSGGSTQVYTGPDADPNGIVTPQVKTDPAIYYQDNASPVNQWNWSVQAQNWFEVLS